MKSAVVIPHVVNSAFSPSLYTYMVGTTRRNLYRLQRLPAITARVAEVLASPPPVFA
jgi:hypothetical protein